MENPKPENQIMFLQLEDRIDPWYYHPKYREIKEKLQKTGYSLIPIDDVVKKTDSLFKPKEHLDEVFNYIETNDVDLEAGKIISSKQITGKSAPSRAKYILKEGDFLIPNARDCIRGIAVVTKEFEGYICTNRFFVVRPDVDKVIPKYLFHILRQPEILCLLKQQATGEINPGINYNALKRVKIPVPDKPIQRKLVQQIEEKEKEIKELLEKIEKCEKDISSIIRGGLPSLEIDRKKMKKLGYDYIGDL